MALGELSLPYTTAIRCATAPSSTTSNASQNCWDSGGDENLRRERQKLLLGLLLTSQGVPILLQGDEFGATKFGAVDQDGASNSYNYEAEPPDPKIDKVNLVDWRLLDGDNSLSPNGPSYGPELFDWSRDLIALRKTWTHFRRAALPTTSLACPMAPAMMAATPMPGRARLLGRRARLR